MNIYKVLPSLKKKRQMTLWHKALRAQWSAADIKWDKPKRITSRKFRDDMSRVLTPVLMGEQSALYSVASLIPILGHRFEVEGQFYLTTWAVDEARHTELFSVYYDRIEREPMSIRRFPSGYLFQSNIISKDPAEWLAGVLVSEVAARQILLEFKRLDLDPVLSDISDGILLDEARHLGFNHIYLEDRIAGLQQKSPQEADSYAKHLHERLEKVLSGAPPVFNALSDSFEGIGMDTHKLYYEISKEAKERLDRSIDAGRRVAAKQADASRLDNADEVGRQADAPR